VAHVDMPLPELRAYRPDLAVPDDLDRFWSDTLAEARGHPLDATFTRFDGGLAVLDTYDVTFAGFGGSPVRAWLHLPAGNRGPLPAVVEFVGYGGGRAWPTSGSSGPPRATPTSSWTRVARDRAGRSGTRRTRTRRAPPRTPGS